MKQDNLQAVLAEKRNKVYEHFGQFNTDEFYAENQDLSVRKDKLFSEFENVRTKIEDNDFVIEGEALDGLKNLVCGTLLEIGKGVDITDKYISLHDLLDGAKKKATLKNQHLQFIGELFAKLEWRGIDEGRKIQKIQHALKPSYNQLWIDNMEIKFAAEAVNELEAKWLKGELPQEEQTINEDASVETEN